MKTALLLMVWWSLMPAGFGEQPLDGTAAASRMGQTVTTQDVVKSVSRPKSRAGYYLSFGAPFPKQSLSVWIPDEVWLQLPQTSLTWVDRTVRVTGQITPSGTGPTLNVDSPAKVALLPIDAAAMLSKMKLDGFTDHDHFISAVSQAFSNGEVEVLDVLSSELMETKERFSDGTWILAAFFTAIKLGAEVDNGIFTKAGETITLWRSRYPSSVPSIVAMAGYHADLAWKARGYAPGPEVTPQGWEQFHRELAVARMTLEANPEAKQCPEYFPKLERIAMGLDWEKPEFFRVFEEGIALAPDYHETYLRAALYLQPKWHGEPGDVDRFLDQQREKIGGAAGDALYTEVLCQLINESSFVPERVPDWEKLAAGFDALIQQHPDSRSLKNRYAHWAWCRRDRQRLRIALKTMGEPDMSIWANLQNVEFAETFASSDEPAATPSPSPAAAETRKGNSSARKIPAR